MLNIKFRYIACKYLNELCIKNKKSFINQNVCLMLSQTVATPKDTLGLKPV